MKRRAFLTGTVGTLSFLAGCVSSLPFNPRSNSTSNPTNKITRQNLTISEQYNVTNSSLPIVKFRPDRNQITIFSTIQTGSKECTHPSIKNTTYTPERDSLRVELGSKSDSDSDQICSAVAIVGIYNITLTVRKELPTSVTINNGKNTTTIYNPSRCKTVSQKGENRTLCWNPNEASQSKTVGQARIEL